MMLHRSKQTDTLWFMWLNPHTHHKQMFTYRTTTTINIKSNGSKLKTLGIDLYTYGNVAYDNNDNDQRKKGLSSTALYFAF